MNLFLCCVIHAAKIRNDRTQECLWLLFNCKQHQLFYFFSVDFYLFKKLNLYLNQILSFRFFDSVTNKDSPLPATVQQATANDKSIKKVDISDLIKEAYEVNIL